MRRYALRGILAHKRRLLSTVTAVLLGVAFMAGSLVFTDTMKASLSGAFQDGERSTDVLVRGPVTITTGQGTQHAPVPAGLAADLAAVDGVAAVAPRLEGFAQVLGTDGKPVDDLSGGAAPSGEAWAADERLNPFELVAGRAPRGADEVVVDRSTADAADLSVGDRTSVLTGAAPQEMTVVGIATFAGQDNRAGNRTVLFSAATADRLLGGDGRVDAIALLADDGVDQARLAKRVEAVLPATDEAITGTALAEENGKRTNEDVTFFSLFMTVFAVVALLVGAFIISNTFSILVAQRTRELALLRAIGASARQVRRSVVLEALVVGAVASALGLFAGVGVARGIQALWSVLGITMPDGPLVVSSRSLVISFVVGVVVTVASALLPARRAARVAPVAAMRAVAVEPVRVSRRRAVIGLVLTAISAASVVLGILDGVVPLVLLGALGALFGVATLAPLLARPVVRLLAALLPRLVGIRGLLARENAVRNPRRTAATASALMIGVALVGSITSFAASGKHSVTASFDQEFRGDLVVESGAWVFGGVSPELSTALQAQPEVAVAVPRQFTQARVGDSSAEVTGWSAGLEKVFDVGRTAGSAPTLGADGVALGTSYAKSHDLSLGDSVTITTASGASRSLTVRQLFRHTDWAGAVVVDRATFAALQPGALDTSVYVKGAEGVGAGALRAAVDRVAAPYANADVRDRDEMRAAVASDFNAILGIVFGLLALAIVIALLGIANTVALSVVERTRELGLLRAVGMGRGHLRGMVRWEAALIAVFGTVTGLAVGMFLGWAMVFAVSQQVETAEFVVPYGQLGVIVAVAAVCGVVAALLPARRAARLDVLAAIATD
jgi:putative ABC transport system permease protein